MKTKFKMTLVFLIISIIGYAQKKEDKRTMEWRYEVECAGVAGDGSYLVKVYTFSKKSANFPYEQAKKNAIHAVLFKGIPSNRETGCAGQKPIATNPNIEFEKREFFDTFFQNGGKYMKYVFESTSGNIDPKDVMKVGKEYKIGILVTVSKDLLRKDLEAAGIIRSLSEF
jgi:hypothetical protein